jgi:hypothetical protein
MMGFNRLLAGAALLLSTPVLADTVVVSAARMIAIASDPTSDVRLLERVPVVIKGGVPVKDAR